MSTRRQPSATAQLITIVVCLVALTVLTVMGQVHR